MWHQRYSDLFKLVCYFYCNIFSLQGFLHTDICVQSQSCFPGTSWTLDPHLWLRATLTRLEICPKKLRGFDPFKLKYVKQAMKIDDDEPLVRIERGVCKVTRTYWDMGRLPHMALNAFVCLFHCLGLHSKHQYQWNHWTQHVINEKI